jgi:hypothetical protein
MALMVGVIARHHDRMNAKRRKGKGRRRQSEFPSDSANGHFFVKIMLEAPGYPEPPFARMTH